MNGLWLSIYCEVHHPNWRTPSFFRGVGWNHQPEIDYWVYIPLDKFSGYLVATVELTAFIPTGLYTWWLAMTSLFFPTVVVTCFSDKQVVSLLVVWVSTVFTDLSRNFNSGSRGLTKNCLGIWHMISPLAGDVLTELSWLGVGDDDLQLGLWWFLT